MPVYNEAATIEAVIGRVRALPDLDIELIAVDDGSTDDGTREILERLRPQIDRLLVHEANRGKGAALRTGFAAATGDIVVVQDADLEYDPGDYARLIRPIAEGHADAVYGSRFMGGDSHRVLYFWHYVANRFLTLLSNMFTNLNLSDMETCYKAYRREFLEKLVLREDGLRHRTGNHRETGARESAHLRGGHILFRTHLRGRQENRRARRRLGLVVHLSVQSFWIIRS